MKATIHWVSAAHALPAEVRLYNPLFTKPDPSGGENFTADLNPNSLDVLSGARLEPALADAKPEVPVQFERQGYFCLDPASTARAAGLWPHHWPARHLGEGSGQRSSQGKRRADARCI